MPLDQVICYYGSWAVWRPGDGKFDVDDIDPYLCTTLIFGFAGLNNQTWEIEVTDEYIIFVEITNFFIVNIFTYNFTF